VISDAVVISAIGGLVSLGSGILVIVNTVMTARIKLQGEKNAEHIAQTHHAIQELETNPNSIKDALVKVTGEAEFAKGLKIGTEAAAAGPQGEEGPKGDKGDKGDRGGIFH
jgi:hypothetical protein